MKICLFFLSLCVLYCNGFLLDDCHTDSDCKNGCCRLGTFGLGNSCIHQYLPHHHTCHLNGHEYNNCGCGPGLTCSDHMDSSQAIAIEGSLRPGYGYCEKGNGTSSSGGGMIATEG